MASSNPHLTLTTGWFLRCFLGSLFTWPMAGGWFLQPGVLAEDPWDIVFIQGVDLEGKPIHVAVRNGCFDQVAHGALPPDWTKRAKLVVDAQGGTLSPGFNDAHVHFLSGSLALTQLNLLDASDLTSVETAVRNYEAEHPNAEVLVGRGWLYGAFPNGLPDRQMLDAWIANRPAILRCYDGHTVWVNSEALRRAGIDATTPDPVGGVIVRDADGHPTGVLKEAAQNLVESLIPKPTPDAKRTAIRQGVEHACDLGVTSIQEAGLGIEDIVLLASMQRDGEFPLGISIAIEGRPPMSEEDVAECVRIRQTYPDLHLHAVKLYADGVIEAHTASLLAPYANRPTRGMPECSAADLQATIQRLDAAGFQIQVHAIGDGGVRMVLDALEEASRVNPIPTRGRRHRLEHVETIDPIDIPRTAKLEVIASMQPYHADPNGNLFQVWAVNLGSERASRAWCWKRMQDEGVRLAFGTDWPVVGLDPRQGLHTAMTRQTLEGEPESGFLPQERLSLQSAIAAYTEGSAYAEFREAEKGRIAVGMRADLNVWDANLVQLSVRDVHRAKIRKTLLAGRLVRSR